MNQIRALAGSLVGPPSRRGPRLRPRRVVGGRTVVRLWLPLTLLFALLSPIAAIAAPLIDLHPAGRRARPIRTVWALGAVLLSLAGTVVEVDTPAARVSIRIF